mgnify:CR=1 FL=1
MSEIDTRKLIESLGERVNTLARLMPLRELGEPLRALQNDLQNVLTVMLNRIEKLEEQLEKQLPRAGA